MGRFIGAILVCIALIAFGWRFFPAPLKERATKEFAGAAGSGGKKAVEIVKKKILPKNPREERQELIEKLKENAEILKERTVSVNPLAHDPEEKTLPELVTASEAVIKELEKANNDLSLKEKIAEKVLNMIVREKEVCEVKEK